MQNLRQIVLRCLFLFIALVCQKAYCNTTIHIVADDWAPMHFSDNEGNIDGALLNIAVRVTQLAGYKHQVTLLPFSRGLLEVQQQSNVLMLSVAKTGERESKYQWLFPLYEDQSYFITLKSRSHVQLSSPEQARGYVVGTVRGHLTESIFVEQGFIKGQNLMSAGSTKSVWELLAKGRIDLLVSTRNLAYYEATNAGVNPQSVRGALALGTPSKVYAVMSLSTDSQVISNLKTAYNLLLNSGELDQILQQWNVKPLQLSNNLIDNTSTH